MAWPWTTPANLYIADTGNHRIRRVDSNGIITTIAGTYRDGFRGDDGPAVQAQLDSPFGVAVDDAGNLYIADTGNHRIRRVDSDGIITTIAGTYRDGFRGDDGPAVQAQLDSPFGVAVDDVGNLYIADTRNHVIRRVDSNGIITTIAGTGVRGYGGDRGPGVDADLNSPNGVAVDSAGNLYIADWGNRRIRGLTLSARWLLRPTNLKAKAVSTSQINLGWQDNSANETGFIVQRRREDSAVWIPIGTTLGDATAFSDDGLLPSTSYRYRIRAFSDTRSSIFSKEAMATTLMAPPPTVTGFVPTRGPVGTKVTLTGIHFRGAIAVIFNGVGDPQFEVVSETSIRATVPPEATSGPVSVITASGTGVSADPFTVTTGGISSRIFVPIVLRARGRAGSFFTSELTLCNRGSRDADIRYTYTASFGSGSGTAVDFLRAGEQRVIPDAIDYLTFLGVPIGTGSVGGTLKVDFSKLSSASDASIIVRVSTPVEEGQGRAGLAYFGLNPDGLLSGPAFITGLRQNVKDRSNVAVQNAGDARDGNLTLRVTVFSGGPTAPGRKVVFPDLPLGPGRFHQYNGILDMAGFDNGYVKVERVSGTAAYYAYGVINDQVNSDGAFVFPVRADSLVGKRGLTLPAIVESGPFDSELTMTNFSPVAKTLHFTFVADGIQTANQETRFSLKLKAGEQRIIPDIVQALREGDFTGLGFRGGSSFAGALFATVDSGDMSGIVIGARTGSPGGGGEYSVFYNAVPYGAAFRDSAWIYGLQQNEENRSNLALVNTGEVDTSVSVFNLDIYDGDTGILVNTVGGVQVSARRWRQFNRFLANYTQGTEKGYVQIKKTSGNNPFLAYGVINDGGAPGERSGDGAFLPSQE